jgi:hypothetical protein
MRVDLRRPLSRFDVRRPMLFITMFDAIRIRAAHRQAQISGASPFEAKSFAS